MLITDNFIFMHQPKTGGTFVTAVLLRLHGIPWNARKIGNKTSRVWETPYGEVILRGPKHNSCGDIPDGQRSRKVLATARNPYDRYVSEYEFGWWKREEYLDDFRRGTPDFDRRYPGFPNISFSDFLSFANRQEIIGRTNIGAQTIGFIWRYFRDPERVLAELKEDYFSSGRHRADMFDVHFLNMDRLNQDLHDFLIAAGYPASALAFILETGKILPTVPPEGETRHDHRSLDSYYSRQSAAFVRHRERHLLALFPEFDGLPERLPNGASESAS